MRGKSHRHYLAQLFMMIISFIGWGIALNSLLNLKVIERPFEILFLLVFIFLCEYYPMPFKKGNSSLTFPVVYLVYLIHGLEITIILYFVSVFLTTLINQRPLRIIFFNPAQLIISFALTHLLEEWFMQEFDFSASVTVFLSFLVFICFFYLFNNLIVDTVLTIRPEKYSFAIWADKGRGELFSFSVSMVYGLLIHFWGNQNRGEIDIFAFFFFLSPLIFLAIISSTIIRLKADKQRLKALFHFSSELNRAIPIIDNWENDIKRLINEVVSYEEGFLFTIDDKKSWNYTVLEGSLHIQDNQLGRLEELNHIQTITVYNKLEMHTAPLSQFFSDYVLAAVYAPLIFDDEMIGCLILTKTRTNSFIVEDVHSIATIANQLSIFLKTQNLFSEKEQRILLEERNRIAHDIHDGVAQTLAGAVMLLDTAGKKITLHPLEAKVLIDDSNNILREGLKEVRDSIYALRPYPTEQLGLHIAIKKKVEKVTQDKKLGISISFITKGIQVRLSLLTEKIIFSIIQESIQNCIKHAEATEMTILLSYQQDQIYLKLKDNGIGFSLYEAMTAAMKEPHYGILQMNEDAAKVGATLEIESRENLGTDIILRIPKKGYEGRGKYD